MNVVEVKGLCKSLGKKEILKNVSFTIVSMKSLASSDQMDRENRPRRNA